MSTAMSNPERVLSDLGKIDGVASTAVASFSGLFMSNMDSPHSKTFATMSEAILRVSDRSCGKYLPGRMVVESDHGKLIAVCAGSGAMVMALAEPDTKLEPVLDGLEKAAKHIRDEKVFK